MSPTVSAVGAWPLGDPAVFGAEGLGAGGLAAPTVFGGAPFGAGAPLAMLLEGLEGIGGPTRVQVSPPQRKPSTQPWISS